ncbi:hypothetical protein HDK77DRAFT_486894 [Phyllosticta capitalensis]
MIDRDIDRSPRGYRSNPNTPRDSPSYSPYRDVPGRDASGPYESYRPGRPEKFTYRSDRTESSRSYRPAPRPDPYRSDRPESYRSDRTESYRPDRTESYRPGRPDSSFVPDETPSRKFPPRRRSFDLTTPSSHVLAETSHSNSHLPSGSKDEDLFSEHSRFTSKFSPKARPLAPPGSSGKGSFESRLESSGSLENKRPTNAPRPALKSSWTWKSPSSRDDTKSDTSRQTSQGSAKGFPSKDAGLSESSLGPDLASAPLGPRASGFAGPNIIPKDEASSMNTPHIFISARHVPFQPTTIKHMARMVKRSAPSAWVKGNDDGYYILFPNDAQGRDDLKKCVKEQDNKLLFNMYNVVMEERLPENRVPSRNSPVSRKSPPLPKVIKRGAGPSDQQIPLGGLSIRGAASGSHEPRPNKNRSSGEHKHYEIKKPGPFPSKLEAKAAVVGDGHRMLTKALEERDQGVTIKREDIGMDSAQADARESTAVQNPPGNDIASTTFQNSPGNNLAPTVASTSAPSSQNTGWKEERRRTLQESLRKRRSQVQELDDWYEENKTAEESTIKRNRSDRNDYLQSIENIQEDLKDLDGTTASLQEQPGTLVGKRPSGSQSSGKFVEIITIDSSPTHPASDKTVLVAQSGPDALGSAPTRALSPNRGRRISPSGNHMMPVKTLHERSLSFSGDALTRKRTTTPSETSEVSSMTRASQCARCKTKHFASYNPKVTCDECRRAYCKNCWNTESARKPDRYGLQDSTLADKELTFLRSNVHPQTCRHCLKKDKKPPTSNSEKLPSTEQPNDLSSALPAPPRNSEKLSHVEQLEPQPSALSAPTSNSEKLPTMGQSQSVVDSSRPAQEAPQNTPSSDGPGVAVGALPQQEIAPAPTSGDDNVEGKTTSQVQPGGDNAKGTAFPMQQDDDNAKGTTTSTVQDDDDNAKGTTISPVQHGSAGPQQEHSAPLVDGSSNVAQAVAAPAQQHGEDTSDEGDGAATSSADVTAESSIQVQTIEDSEPGALYVKKLPGILKRSWAELIGFAFVDNDNHSMASNEIGQWIDDNFLNAESRRKSTSIAATMAGVGSNNRFARVPDSKPQQWTVTDPWLNHCAALLSQMRDEAKFIIKLPFKQFDKVDVRTFGTSMKRPRANDPLEEEPRKAPRKIAIKARKTAGGKPLARKTASFTPQSAVQEVSSSSPVEQSPKTTLGEAVPSVPEDPSLHRAEESAPSVPKDPSLHRAEKPAAKEKPKSSGAIFIPTLENQDGATRKFRLVHDQGSGPAELVSYESSQVSQVEPATSGGMAAESTAARPIEIIELSSDSENPSPASSRRTSRHDQDTAQDQDTARDQDTAQTKDTAQISNDATPQARPPLPPLLSQKIRAKLEAEVRNTDPSTMVKDLFKERPELAPQPEFDREAKIAEIKARPKRKDRMKALSDKVDRQNLLHARLERPRDFIHQEIRDYKMPLHYKAPPEGFGENPRSFVFDPLPGGTQEEGDDDTEMGDDARAAANNGARIKTDEEGEYVETMEELVGMPPPWRMMPMITEGGKLAFRDRTARGENGRLPRPKMVWHGAEEELARGKKLAGVGRFIGEKEGF